VNYITFYLINLKSQYNYFFHIILCGQTKSPVTFIDFRKQIIWGNKYITFENKTAEFSVLIVFIQFFGIDCFTMLNSAIQLDLNFTFSRMNLLDKISLTYIKSLFIQFSKTIGLF
jgi:hypothetical protein